MKDTTQVILVRKELRSTSICLHKKRTKYLYGGTRMKKHRCEEDIILRGGLIVDCQKLYINSSCHVQRDYFNFSVTGTNIMYRVT